MNIEPRLGKDDEKRKSLKKSNCNKGCKFRHVRKKKKKQLLSLINKFIRFLLFAKLLLDVNNDCGSEGMTLWIWHRKYRKY